MSRGIVFDIREFTVHDGPGIRTTVFMKGCPLRCTWCHNPEGLQMTPQVMRSAAGERLVGRAYEAEELASILVGQADVLRLDGGGVTFSGGEPLMQAGFVAEVIDRLGDMHVVLDTSGFADAEDFSRVVERTDLVYFDIKLIDPDAHRRWTGQDNGPILWNLALLEQLARPFVARIPLVPGVTDTDDNLRAIASTLALTPTLVEVQLLPYNRAAGGK
jgi:pyruvate formate lyase activating enzyme